MAALRLGSFSSQCPLDLWMEGLQLAVPAEDIHDLGNGLEPVSPLDAGTKGTNSASLAGGTLG